MNTLLKVLIQVIVITIVSEAFSWLTTDYITYNAKTIDTNLEFLYYTLPALLVLGMAILVKLRYEKLQYFVTNTLLVLVNIYGFLCFIMIT